MTHWVASHALLGAVPRTRGDEPTSDQAKFVHLDGVPFPARAGMNRPFSGWIESDGAVPRTRGDEPEYEDDDDLVQARQQVEAQSKKRLLTPTS